MCAFVKDDVKLGVIGCGKMASAILGGIASHKFISSEDICVYDINIEHSGALCREYGFREAYSIQELMEYCDVILLAVKPFIVGEVLSEMKDFYNNHLILSILAGVKIQKYLKYIKNAKIIRIMPNTPALVQEGMSAVCANNNTTEDKIDIITALSGSGPAFYFKIIELMANSATKLGLDKNEALLLSNQTALGSAKMIFENDFEIEQLIKNVTTPGGCTEVGNNVLNSSDMADILDKTIKDTMQKAIELG